MTAQPAGAVIDQFDAVLSKLIADVFYKHAALGSENPGLDTVLQHLADRRFSRRPDELFSSPGRSLDKCFEVHIHEKSDLAHDVDWLAVDRPFHATKCGDQITELSKRFGFPIIWNPRFEIATVQVLMDFRGPKTVPLANHTAPDGVLNAATIGQAVFARRTFPNAWEKWGSFEETLQYLEQIWHVLVTFGHVFRES